MVEHALQEAALAAEAALAGEAAQDRHLTTQGSPHFNEARVHSVFSVRSATAPL